MVPRLINLPVLFILLLFCLLSTTLIGGCPAAQTPTVPPQEEEGQGTQQPPTTPDDGLDRPISQPELDTTTSEPGGNVPTGEGGQGGAGGGGGETELVILSVEEPSDPMSVPVPPRADSAPLISLRFNLLDPTGSVRESGLLLLARDDDQDHKPDGQELLSLPIPVTEGLNTVVFNASETVGYLSNGFGRFLLGVRVTTISNDAKTAYSPATITIDAVAPTATWQSPQDDHLVNRDISWTIELTTSDNSPHTVRMWLENTKDGAQYELVKGTTYAAGTATRTFTKSLSAFPAGTYYYYVEVSDGIEPPVAFHAPDPSITDPAGWYRLAVTNRLIGTFELAQLADEPANPAHSKGAIMQGFNFNDLAGSSLVTVPDLDGDGDSELVIGARFGKPNLNSFQGRGWGAAYLIYGDGGTRLKGQRALNSVGSSIAGLTFRGVRVPLCEANYTEGLSDITVVDDMDGDELPELVFSFPRVESLNLGASDWVGSNAFQHPELLPDEPGAVGGLEYDAIDYMSGSWITNKAQFTRGGIVIVSSHNRMLTDADTVTRKFDRVLDLHEVGQMFDFMVRPSLASYIRDQIQNDPFENCADCIPEVWEIADECDEPAETDPNAPGYPDPCCESVEECPDCGDEPCTCEEGCGCDYTGDELDPNETEYHSWFVLWDTWLGGG
jgi:hypothetical protein